MLAGGETGWHGGWQRVEFEVQYANPYITLPRGIARIIDMDIERNPTRIRNEFFEFLPDSVGYQDYNNRNDWCGSIEGFERGTFPSMVELGTTNQLLRFYCSDARDVGKRVLVKGKDNNGLAIYSTSSGMEVNGFYLTLALPFVTSAFQVSTIDNIIKDPTYGDVLLYQVDATTGTQVLLSRYAPDEITPEYRRYFIQKLPYQPAGQHVHVRAMAKLEYVPVSRDTDFLLIGNPVALQDEIEAIRYQRSDSVTAQQLAAIKHASAIKLLQNELVHYGGRQRLAVNVKPFGSAGLEKQMIGQLL